MRAGHSLPAAEYARRAAVLLPVELQIYTLETYLRTVHTDHYTSHQALKKRQFLLGLVLFLPGGGVR
jgi:hypothetical protein